MQHKLYVVHTSESVMLRYEDGCLSFWPKAMTSRIPIGFQAISLRTSDCLHVSDFVDDGLNSRTQRRHAFGQCCFETRQHSESCTFSLFFPASVCFARSLQALTKNIPNSHRLQFSATKLRNCSNGKNHPTAVGLNGARKNIQKKVMRFH